MKTYYLNNSGSRAVHYDNNDNNGNNGKKIKVLLYHGAEGYCKMRTVEYTSMFCNCGCYHIRYKGKMHRMIPENCNGVIVCFVDYEEKY